MIKYLIFCFVLLLPCIVLGQSKVKQTRLVLKNGSELRGKLLSDSSQLKLQTREGSIWVFSKEEVLSIEKALNPDLHKKKGFLNLTELGILSGANESDNLEPRRYSTMSFRSFNGYQFAPAFALGLTLGGDWYEQAILMPLTLGIRGDFSSGRVTPFYALDIGRGFTWLTEQIEGQSAKGGFALGFGLGIKVKLPSQTCMTLGLGYHHQALEIRDRQWWGWQERFQKTTFNRMSLRMGFGF